MLHPDCAILFFIDALFVFWTQRVKKETFHSVLRKRFLLRNVLQRLAMLLFRAAVEGAYVDPDVVERILQTPWTSIYAGCMNPPRPGSGSRTSPPRPLSINEEEAGYERIENPSGDFEDYYRPIVLDADPSSHSTPSGKCKVPVPKRDLEPISQRKHCLCSLQI